MSDPTQLIASVLKIPPGQLSDEDGAHCLPQWDSLATVMLASMIEVSYGITLASDEIDRLTSVRAVREIVARHRRA